MWGQSASEELLNEFAHVLEGRLFASLRFAGEGLAISGFNRQEKLQSLDVSILLCLGRQIEKIRYNKHHLAPYNVSA